MMATTGTITFVLKLICSLVQSLSMTSRFWQALYAQNEIGFDFAGFRHGNFPGLARQPFVPGLQFVSAGRNVRQSVTAFFVGHSEVRVFQHENDAAHPGMNRAE